VKARPADRNFAGDDPQRAFTPAVILLIALPEEKDKLEPGQFRWSACRGDAPFAATTRSCHGRRLRPAHDDRHQRIWVRHGICRPCGKTFTVLPHWLVPAAPFTLSCRQLACERLAAGDSPRKTSPFPADMTYPDRVYILSRVHAGRQFTTVPPAKAAFHKWLSPGYRRTGHLQSHLNDADRTTKREVIRALVQRIEIWTTSAVVGLRVPAETNTRTLEPAMVTLSRA
jgi:hypothetical protein